MKRIIFGIVVISIGAVLEYLAIAMVDEFDKIIPNRIISHIIQYVVICLIPVILIFISHKLGVSDFER